MTDIPGINIFLMNVPQSKDMPKEHSSKLKRALSRKEDESMAIKGQMLHEIKRLTEELKTMPRVAHTGGG